MKTNRKPFKHYVVFLLVVLGSWVIAQLEPSASAWKTWVLTSSDQVQVEAPPDEATTQTELAEVMSLVTARTDEDLARIAYWSAGAPGYRWNQIATKQGLENNILLNNYRLIPYLNIAIYDATVAAWNAKYNYNRPRPSVLASSLATALPTPPSPSYPSEHAVTAGAAEVVLSYFFPEQARAFKTLAEEAAQTFVTAGVQYPSDVDAGLELGRKVGELVIERAKADNSDAVWTGTRPTGPGIFAMDSLGDETIATWKTWVLSSGSEVRPPAPPAPDSPERAAEILELQDLQSKRDAQPFVELSFWPTDPSGRPDPASAAVRWSQVAYYYAPLNHLLWLPELEGKIFEYHWDDNPPRAARAYALVSVALFDATVAVWDGRFAYWTARPVEFDPTLTTILTTYPTPEYPSGHTGLATATSEVLAYLFPGDASYFRSRAVELGESRIWAGIHFRSAVNAGHDLGVNVAEKVIEWANQDGSVIMAQ
jgi:membrane-associated phospholipid phosphatase